MVNHERAVPALVDSLVVVVDDVGVEVVEALLPGFVFAEERIGAVLLDGPQGEFRVLGVFHDPSVEQKAPPQALRHADVALVESEDRPPADPPFLQRRRRLVDVLDRVALGHQRFEIEVAARVPVEKHGEVPVR